MKSPHPPSRPNRKSGEEWEKYIGEKDKILYYNNNLKAGEDHRSHNARSTHVIPKLFWQNKQNNNKKNFLY